jgi:YidC/Oxa1 family membrane protein insertase
MFQTLFFQPILNLLVFLYNIVPGNDLGIAIILMTIVIKLILWPLSKKSIQSQKALQELQPQINEIKKKYKDKKEEMGREIMNLYKNNKVNPFSSCLPLLVQLPFLFAVFKVFRDGFANGSLDLVYPFITRPEVINTMTIGSFDLAERSIALALLAGAAQFWQGKMLSTKRPVVKTEGSKDEDFAAIMNKQMIVMMPILTVFISLSFPAGLALYWLTTTILTGVQQLIVFNKNKKKEFRITFACMRSFADFLIIHYRGGEIWVKEKVQPLKIINALFLEPHTRCYRCNHDKEKRSFYLNAIWPLSALGLRRSEYCRTYFRPRWFGRGVLVGALERHHHTIRFHRIPILEQHPLL